MIQVFMNHYECQQYVIVPRKEDRFQLNLYKSRLTTYHLYWSVGCGLEFNEYVPWGYLLKT